MGVFQFSPSSRNITVSEDAQTIRICVQRLFGFHGDLIKVSYETTAGSAEPLEDFEPLQKGDIFFQRFQTEVDFEITIINDQRPEIEETFYINLTSVEAGGVGEGGVSWRPRLNPDLSVAVVTILDNDDLAGVAASLPMTAGTVAGDSHVPVTAGTVAGDSTALAMESGFTTHPSKSKITPIPYTMEVFAPVTETAGVTAIPEKLATTHSAISVKPDVGLGTADTSVYGTLSVGPPIVYVSEEMKNSTPSSADILIQRSGGSSGSVSITVRTFGGRCAQKEPSLWPSQDVYGVGNLTWATEEEDFEEQMLTLTFLNGERERKITVRILDDDEPEGQEFFYVFLTDPQGGAEIVTGKDSTGFSAVAVVIITGNIAHYHSVLMGGVWQGVHYSVFNTISLSFHL